VIDGAKRDHARFRQIVRGKIKQDLKKFIQHSEMFGRKGKDTVSIPMPQIDIPRFRFGSNQGGVGQGEGNAGDPIPGQGDPAQEGEGPGQGQKAGKEGGEHELEVEFTLEELAEILGEELSLPKIEPRGQKTLKSKVDKYTSIASQGPNSLRHFKRTFKEALKRQIATGIYNPDKPIIIPIKKDMRYRSWKSDVKHENSAVIIYMMDVSGSMGDEQKEIVRTETFWINTWLKSQYKGVEARYIIHDATAKEVDEDTFFRTRESGGTLISSAYKLCEQIIDQDYPPSDWNIYPFHFSDGDNWSTEDTKVCIDMMKNSLLNKVNVFCYGQVDSRYGSGQFYKDLVENFGSDSEEVITSRIENKDGILASIKEFLGKGK
jgi:sporulation protein YhbH